MIAGTWDPDRGVNRVEATYRRGESLIALAGEVYEEDGIDALAAGRLPDGAYAAVIWDGRGTVVAVDPLGQGGMYVQYAGRGVRFASEFHGLLDLVERTPSVDADALRRWVLQVPLAPTATLLEGVRRLAPGERLRLGGASTRVRPEPKRAPGEPAQIVRDGVLAAVEGRTREPAALLLSGGLDSTVLAAAAAGRVRAYSVRFPGLRGQDETEWIDLVSRELNLETVRVSVHGGIMVAGILDWTARWRAPLAAPTWFYQVHVVERMAADGAVALLDGEGGDELFAAPRYLPADRLRAGHPFEAVRLVRRMPGARAASRGRVTRVVRDYAVRGAFPLPVHRTLRGGGPDFELRWGWKRYPAPR